MCTEFLNDISTNSYIIVIYKYKIYIYNAGHSWQLSYTKQMTDKSQD